jgi:hypothetical protein
LEGTILRHTRTVAHARVSKIPSFSIYVVACPVWMLLAAIYLRFVVVQQHCVFVVRRVYHSIKVSQTGRGVIYARQAVYGRHTPQSRLGGDVLLFRRGRSVRDTSNPHTQACDRFCTVQRYVSQGGAQGDPFPHPLGFTGRVPRVHRRLAFGRKGSAQRRGHRARMTAAVGMRLLLSI